MACTRITVPALVRSKKLGEGKGFRCVPCPLSESQSGYAIAGPRQDPAAHLQIPDIDTDRMLLHIHGKGKKDRYVPLPDPTLQMLRAFWRTHRSPCGCSPRLPLTVSRTASPTTAARSPAPLSTAPSIVPPEVSMLQVADILRRNASEALKKFKRPASHALQSNCFQCGICLRLVLLTRRKNFFTPSQSRGQQPVHPGGIGFQPVRNPFGYRPRQAEAYPTTPETEGSPPGSNFPPAALLWRDPEMPTGEQPSPRLSFWTLHAAGPSLQLESTTTDSQTRPATGKRTRKATGSQRVAADRASFSYPPNVLADSPSGCCLCYTLGALE